MSCIHNLQSNQNFKHTASLTSATNSKIRSQQCQTEITAIKSNLLSTEHELERVNSRLHLTCKACMRSLTSFNNDYGEPEDFDDSESDIRSENVCVTRMQRYVLNQLSNRKMLQEDIPIS